mgnify:CR=1 FL=1
MDRRIVVGVVVVVAAVAAYVIFRPNEQPGATLEPQQLIDLLADTARAPVMVDAETRLRGADSEGAKLTYHYILVQMNKADIDSRKFVALKKPEIVASACTRAEVRYLLNQGATLAYVYDDKLGERIADVGLARSDCPAQ